MHVFMIVFVILLDVCTCLFTVQLHFYFTYRIVSCIYNEYTVNIFRCRKLSLHDSRCFNPAVYPTALFWRIKITLVSGLALCPHTTIPYDRKGLIKL
jgi:hypothetical protein